MRTRVFVYSLKDSVAAVFQIVDKGVSHQRHPLRNIKNNTPITKCNRGMVKCAYEH